jgi:beta-lactam-binding protein with PASTA domain
VGGFAVTIHNPTAPVEVPDLSEDTATLAATKLHAVGLVPNFTGSSAASAHVDSQDPKAFELVLRGTTVTVYMKATAHPL